MELITQYIHVALNIIAVVAKLQEFNDEIEEFVIAVNNDNKEKVAESSD